MDHFPVLFRIAQFSSLVPVALGLVKFKSLPKTGKLFFYFMVFTACTEFIAHVLAILYNNSMPFMYVYTLVEFVVFSYILIPRLVLFADHFKPLFYGLIALISVLLVTDVYIHSIYALNTISKVTECVLIVFMGLVYLLQYIQSDSDVEITGDYVFWIASGATLYFAVTFVFFTIYNTLLAIDVRFSDLTHNAHQIASILSYIMYGISFYVIQKKQMTK